MTMSRSAYELPPHGATSSHNAARQPGPPDVISVCAKAIQVLIGNGETTEQSVEAVVKIARRFGYKASVMPRWGEATIRLENDDAESLDFVLVAPPAIVDMHKVAAANAVVDAICQHRMTAVSGLHELEAITGRAPISAARLISMSAAGAAALGIIFGATETAVVGAIALVAACGAVLRRLLGRFNGNPYLQPLGAAFLAGLASAACLRHGLGREAVFIGFCPCMVLLPGPHLLGGSLDLARMRLPFGTMRILHAGLIILVICTGLVLGLSLAGITLQPFVAAQAPVPLPWDVLSAGVAVAAFGGFFAIPWRMLPVPVATGMIAHALHWILITECGVGLAAAAFIASLVVGTSMTLVAGRLNLPFAGCAFAAVVSMIPGVYMFRMAGGLTALVGMGANTPVKTVSGLLSDGVTAAVVVLAIGFGLIIPVLGLHAKR